MRMHKLRPTNAWFTPATFGDFCRFKLCSTLVIQSHGVSDFILVIWVDFPPVISDLGRHQFVRGEAAGVLRGRLSGDEH